MKSFVLSHPNSAFRSSSIEPDEQVLFESIVEEGGFRVNEFVICHKTDSECLPYGTHIRQILVVQRLQGSFSREYVVGGVDKPWLGLFRDDLLTGVFGNFR